MAIGEIQLENYRSSAIERTRRVAPERERNGVEVVITGSLACGVFERSSDVDFVVLKCPRHLKYAIESIVEDGLEGIPFDVVYGDEMPPAKLGRFMDGAVRACDLR